MTPTTLHLVPAAADLLEAPSATPRNPEGSKLAPLVHAGVWCEALVTVEDSTGTGRQAERRWDAYAAPSPRAAIRWMRSSVQTVTPTLGRLQRGYVLDHWVHGPASLEDFARLCRGRPCLLTVYRDGAEIAWRARPVRFLPTAAVNGRPPCTGPRHRARTGVSHAW